ncbi:tetratricopeptide repeat protein [Aerosakkonema sp. BLCC-F183]|uniref:tetratricopeptide repeat protein n=1 Tax=Aerosakkonema sp. BLCC-F183 TaxID=3342834 RepID=UPI0035BB08B2
MASARWGDMPSGTLRKGETLADMNRRIKQNPDDAKALAHRGENYRLTGQFEAALNDFNRSIELEPDYAWAHAHRGETYRLMKCYEEAIADLSRSLALNPKHAWTLAHRGASYYQLKQYRNALIDINQAIGLQPDYPWALVYRINLYIRMGSYEEALVDFDRAIALDKTIIAHWPGERGLLLSYMGRYAEVISCCEQGLKDNSNDYITLYTLAVVKARFEGRAAAQTEIETTRNVLQAVKDRSKRAGVVYRLGGLAALEGDWDLALNCLQEAISLDNEPLELARRDVAWLELREHPRFQSLINQEG